MGSLSDLVSDVEELHAPLHVGTSTVLITLRYGKPDAVFWPGSRIKKTWRSGGGVQRVSPEGIRVSTKEVGASLKLEAVGLSDAYQIAKLDVPFRIRVSPTDGYAGLLNYVTERGLNFAELLQGDVENELGAAVRKALHEYTADVLYDHHSLIELIRDAAPTSLLGGLFEIVQLNVAKPEWDPAFLRVRKLRAEAAATAEETEITIESAPVKRALADSEAELAEDQAEREHRHAEAESARRAELEREESARRDALAQEEAVRRDTLEAEESQRRLDRMADEAERLGLTLREYERREELEQAAERARERLHELQIKALEMLGNPDGRRLTPETIRAVERLAAPPSSAGALPASDTHTSDNIIDSTAVDADPLSLDALRSDGALARMWETAGIPGHPLALGFDAAHPVTVIVVTSDAIDQVVTTTINRTFQQGMGAEVVVAITETRTIADVIEGYILARVPELVPIKPVIDLRTEDRRLVVLLSSPNARLGSLLAKLGDPILLGPLTRILPFDVIEVVQADEQS